MSAQYSILGLYLGTSTLPSLNVDAVSGPSSPDPELSPTRPLRLVPPSIFASAVVFATSIQPSPGIHEQSVWSNDVSPAPYAQVEKLPTPRTHGELPSTQTVTTGFTDLDYCPLSEDRSSYRAFLHSPRKWFSKAPKLQPKVEEEPLESPSAALRENTPMEIIKMDSPGLDRFDVGDEDPKRRDVYEEDNGVDVTIDRTDPVFDTYLNYLHSTAEFSGLNRDEDFYEYAFDTGAYEEDEQAVGQEQGSQMLIIPKLNPVCDGIDIVSYTQGHPNEEDRHRAERTLSRRSTLRKLTSKTKEIFRHISASAHHESRKKDHSTCAIDEEEKENLDPITTLSRRRSLRSQFSSVSLKRSLSRRWSKRKQGIVGHTDSQVALVNRLAGDIDSDPENPSNGRDLILLFDTAEFKSRLDEGAVLKRKIYDTEDEDGLVTYQVSVDAPSRRVLGELTHRDVSGQNVASVPGTGLAEKQSTFSLFRRRTLKRAQSFGLAARAAAREFMSPYGDEN